MTHPHHPLYNQIIQVLRRAGNAVSAEPRYLITLPDGTRAEMPVSWAVPVSDPEIQPVVAAEPPELWAGVSELLSLARLVQALSTMEEVADAEPTCFTRMPAHLSGRRSDRQRQPAALGAACDGTPTRINPDPGAASAASSGSAGTAGGES